jgi:hypothetical protein
MHISRWAAIAVTKIFCHRASMLVAAACAAFDQAQWTVVGISGIR